MNLDGYEPLICPKALARKVKGAGFSKAFSKIPDDILRMNTRDLEGFFQPTNIDKLLKRNFWLEIFKRLNDSSKFEPKKIYGDVCTYTHWYNNFLGQPIRLAWLLSSGENMSELIDSHGVLVLEQMREILSLSISDGNKLNHRLIDAKIKIFCALDEARQRYS